MTKQTSKSHEEKRAYADQRACHWLAEANKAAEAGDFDEEAQCLRKAQFWLDALNELEGLS